MRGRLGRLLLFTLIPMVGSLSNLLVVPAVTSRFGLAIWAATAVGVSVGSAISVAVELGWGLAGPMRVARIVGAQSRADLLAVATASKLLIAVPAVIVACGAALVLSPGVPIESALIAGFTALSGLSCLWFFVGTGQPLLILLTDVLPRVAFMGLAAGAISLGAPLSTYVLAVALSSVIPVLIAMRLARARVSAVRRFGFRRLVRLILLQLEALRGRAASALYVSLSVGLVSLGGGVAAVAPFAAIERLMRMVLQLIQSVPQSLQSWVGSSSGRQERARRVRFSILASFIVGLASGALFIVVEPLLSRVLFVGELQADRRLVILAALVVATTATSRAVGGIGLVAQRRISSIANSATAGALMALLLIPALSSIWGAVGGMLGLVIVEFAVLAYQAIALLRHRRP